LYEYDGVLQLMIFVGSSAGLAVTVGLSCGFVGGCAVSVFVRVIYRNLKKN
jgi:hypothetical protein